MTTEEMNQRTLSLIKNIVEHGFDFIESPEDYEKYGFNAWQILAEISGILVALNEFEEEYKKKISCESAILEIKNQTIGKLANNIAAAIKRYNSMLGASDNRRIDVCKTIGDDYIYEFVR